MRHAYITLGNQYIYIEVQANVVVLIERNIALIPFRLSAGVFHCQFISKPKKPSSPNIAFALISVISI